MKLIDRDFELNHYTSMLLNPTPDVTSLDKKNAPIIIDALKMANTIDAIPIDVIDKIRAEIESHICGCGLYNDGLDMAIEIINKHMGDTE